MMIKAILVERGTDDWGSGAYGASRGKKKKHNGVDYACYPGSGIVSRTAGHVTFLGLPYANEHYRYVQVTDHLGRDHRYFYVFPSVLRGEYVEAGQVIGFAQDIASKYSTPQKIMKNHIHYEIKLGGSHLDPEEVTINE